MSELDQFVDVQITVETATLTRQGFSTVLLAAHHEEYPERVRSYSSMDDIEADFAVNTVIWRAAAKFFGQEISPDVLKIGRRANKFSQALEAIPTLTTEGLVVGCTVVSPDGTETVVAHTNGPAETVATIVTALQVLFNAIADLTATDNVTDVGLAADNTGELFDFKTFRGGLTFNDLTADPGIAADLTAIEAEDDDWYGLVLDSNSNAEIAAAAPWVSSRINTKLAGFNTADIEAANATAGNIMETLNLAAYQNMYTIWSGSVLSFAALGWMADNIWADPGSRTWKFKTIAGVVPDTSSILSTTQRQNILDQKGNYYFLNAGAGRAVEGWLADGEFIDIQLTVDALKAGIQEDVAAQFFSQPKIPYTDKGANQLASIVLGKLQEFRGFDPPALDPVVTPTITVPKVADQSVANRTARFFDDLDFTANLAGAIHRTRIRGKLLV